MRRILTLFFLLSILVSCGKDKFESQVPPCSDSPFTRSADYVNKAIATVIATKTGNQSVGGYHIQPSGGPQVTPWIPCNLPKQFQKDSLKINVSGYLLTYPDFKMLNMSKIPFEITDIESVK